ncbi:hypothetical protein [Amycolatopsis stemonae]
MSRRRCCRANIAIEANSAAAPATSHRASAVRRAASTSAGAGSLSRSVRTAIAPTAAVPSAFSAHPIPFIM